MRADPFANRCCVSACWLCSLGDSLWPAHVMLLCCCCWQQYISATRINFLCIAISCYLAKPGQLKVVAVDTGAGIVRLNPEGGGVVVATVKPEITVQQDENLLIYQSTKEIRIAGSGFEEDMKASEVTTAVAFEHISRGIDTHSGERLEHGLVCVAHEVSTILIWHVWPVEGED